MWRIYKRFRIALMTFTLGLAAVYMWSHLRTTYVDLPKAQSGEVLEVFVSDFPYQPRTKYMCEEFTEEGEHQACLDQIIFEGRDMSLYENGGHFCCPEDFPAQRECERSVATARAFLWQHWRQKKRGYLVVKGTDRGTTYERHLFIEPSEERGWRVVERTIPMMVRGPNDLALGELIDVRWKRATLNDENGIKAGTRYLILEDIVGDALIL